MIPLSYDEKGNKLFEFHLMSTGGTRQFDTDKIITRYDHRMLMTGLADFIILGHGKVGSFALSSDKTDIFSVALGAFLNSIAEVFTRYAFPRLAAYNAIPKEQIPTMEFAKVNDIPLTELTDFVVKLAGIDAISFPTENGQLEKALFEKAGLPYVENEKDPQDLANDQAEGATDDGHAATGQY